MLRTFHSPWYGWLSPEVVNSPFLLTAKQFDREDGNVGCHVIAVNDVRHIIAAEELHSGQVSVQLSYFTIEPLPEICSSPSNIFFVAFLSVILD